MKSKLARQLAAIWGKPGCARTHHLCRWQFIHEMLVTTRGRMVK